jgi:hypothetical protein
MSKQKQQAAKSAKRRGLPKSNPAGMPYGAGSMQMRGRVWWMVYRDVEGNTVHRSSGTSDPRVARYRLAQRALEGARARVAALETVMHEEQAYVKEAGRRASGNNEVHDVRGRRGGRGPVRNHPALGGDGAGAPRSGGKRQ